MKYVLFLGCTIPARSRNYELSARKVAEKLGIELVDAEDFICCGFPLKASDAFSSEVAAAYNLCVAQETGLSVMTLCSSCTSALTEVAHELENDSEFREHINERLKTVGLQYRGPVKVRHFARVLAEEFSPEQLAAHFEKDLSGLSVAAHYGCHYLKPSEIYDHFDDVEEPHTIEDLVALTGAKIVDYRGKKRCCGGPVLPVEEKTALSVAKGKLDSLLEAGADALCLVCPFCSVMYDGNQKGIESEFGATYNLPVLYLPQILGIAMGFDRKALGLNMNVVKTKKLLKPYFEDD